MENIWETTWETKFQASWNPAHTWGRREKSGCKRVEDKVRDILVRSSLVSLSSRVERDLSDLMDLHRPVSLSNSERKCNFRNFEFGTGTPTWSRTWHEAHEATL